VIKKEEKMEEDHTSAGDREPTCACQLS
jgi:hypothetical protein